MNKALLDTDTYSEILKAVNPTVVRNATIYRQAQGVLSLSVITVMEIIQGYRRVGASSKVRAFRGPPSSRKKSSRSTRMPPTSRARSPATSTAPACRSAAATP